MRDPSPVDIAVVGIGLRLPPATVGPQQFWAFLEARGDAVRDVPPDRWSWAAYYDPDPAKPARMDVKRAAFLDQRIEEFDATFFGVAPREAAQLDPQQRLLLEVSWEALEDAGIEVQGLRGSRTGVYIGAFMLDNLLQQTEPAARSAIGPQTALTCTNTVLASRLAYTYDFRGPAMTIDTACSSSLVAIHQGVVALTAGECDLVLAGGVNRIFRPEPSLVMSKGRLLAPDGRSKSFSAAADGYGRGEGCGLVVLKRLADAVEDGDAVYAVIESTGVNQDGRTGGPAMPSIEAQAALVANVAATAGIDPATIAFVEAHGTGTAVGDPVEMAALGRVIGQAPGRSSPCVVGSSKAGIGHLEGAAGVAGFAKAALVARHGVVPPQAWLDELNPAIDFDALGLSVATERVALKRGGDPVRVAVNSFGYGGTNAHAVLREPPPPPPALRDTTGGFFPPVVVVSGHTESAAAAVAGGYAKLFRDRGPEPAMLAALAGRTAHGERRVIVGEAEAFAERLDELAAGVRHPDVLTGRATVNKQVQPVFVFSGMGPQWWAMARSLLTGHRHFRAHADRCDRVFRRLAGWSVVQAMLADERRSRMSSTQVAQPANVVIQTGLAAVLAEFGVRPAAVLGHSVGEVAAAHVAGCLGLEDTMALAYHRSRLQGSTAGSGGMLATDLGLDEASELIAAHGQMVSVAAVNGPHATTLAGDVGALNAIAAHLEERNVFCRQLQVEVPYHSPAMDAVLPELREALGQLTAVPGSVPRYSTVDEGFDAAPWDGAYWVRNVRDPVFFHAAAKRAVADGHRLFLEVGPHPVLGLYVHELLGTTRDAVVLSTLHRGRQDRHALIECLSRLWLRGVPVDWSGVLGRARPLGLPPYPWQRADHWQEPPAVRRARIGSSDSPDALHGRPAGDAVGTWDIDLSPTTLPWLPDHQVAGETVFPATGYLDAAISHARVRADGALPVVIEDLEIERPLVLPDHEDLILRVVERDDGRVSFTSRRRTAADVTWRRLASARIARGRYSAPQPAPPPDDVAIDTDADRLYSDLASIGLHYDGDFRAVAGLRADGRHVDVSSPSPVPPGYTLYPPLLDAALHGALAACLPDTERLFVPVRIRRVVVHRRAPGRLIARARLTAATVDRIAGDIDVIDDAGERVVLLQGIELQAVDRPDQSDAWLDARTYEVRWAVTELGPASGDRPDRWWVVSNDPTLVAALADAANAAPGPDDHRPSFRAVGDIAKAADHDGEPGRPGIVVDLRNVPHGDVEEAIRSAQGVLGLVQRLADQQGEGRSELVIVTAGAVAAAADDRVDGWATGWVPGLRRTVANEVDGLYIRHIDVAPTPEHSPIDEGLARAVLDVTDDELAIRGNVSFRPVVLRATSADRQHSWWAIAPARPAAEAASYTLERTGPLLKGLTWATGERRAPGPHEIELRIEAVGLNYKDVLKQLDLLPERVLARIHSGPSLGMEQCAVVEQVGAAVDNYAPGDRVVAGLPGGLRRYATVDPSRALLLPARSEWSDAEAAGLLVSFLTAHRTLVELARTGPGDIVLLHGATGGLGHAAFQVARYCGARVVATAATDEKRAILTGLGAEATFDSRSLDFVEQLQEATQGRGVDVILNTLPGDGLRAALEVAAEDARVVEVGKREVIDGGTLPLDLFDRNITFVSFDLDHLARDRERFLALGQRVLDRFAAGEYQPLPTTTVPAAAIADALGSLARADHTGKLVVGLDDVAGLRCYDATAPSGPIREDRWYVVTGGTGGIGIEAARWLAIHGARHVALLSRRGVLGADAEEKVRSLREAKVEVVVVAVDVTDRLALDAALDRLRASGVAIGGVIHAAGIAHDRPVRELTPIDLRSMMGAKVLGAHHLDLATADDPIELFLLTSSVSALTGTSGQAAYAAANSALEAIAHARRRRGRPASALALGPVADIGMAALTDEVARYVRLYGFDPFPPDRLVEIFDRALTWNRPFLGMFSIDWASWVLTEPTAASSPRFSKQVADLRSGGQPDSLWKRLAPLPADERITALSQVVADALASVLGAEPGTIAADAPLAGLGLDSLMLIELQAHLNATLGAELTLMGLLGVDTVIEAAQGIDHKLTVKDAGR